MNALRKRCIELSFKHKLTHVSSVLNCVDVIGSIYDAKGELEPFILGNSHAALALYVVLESKGVCDAESMLLDHGIHACRDMQHGIWVSGGSLGQAETVAVGLALADTTRKVYLVTSDGACMEGAVAEAFRFADDFCPNLYTTIIFNGYGAYGPIDERHIQRLNYGPNFHIHHVDQLDYPEWLRALPGHYLTLTESQQEELLR